MADIAKKITKLDEKIGKLKERIKSDTTECEKLSEQKALLIYQSLCKQYSCEGQALADMIAREHEQAATSGADDADEEEMLGQTSFFENDPYGVIMAKQTIYNAGIYVRLSQEDMRAGESLSIENQKLILVQLRTRTVSYKNHKVIKNDEEDMIVVKNTHEAIVSQELWDRVREMEQSVSQGKRNSDGYVANLSGLIYCQDCGNKVRLCWNNTTNGSKKKPRKYIRHNYNCTSYMKFGKRYCPSHYIKMQDMDAIVLEDIRSLAQLVVEDEEKAKAGFLARKAKHHEEQYSVDTKKLTEGKFRLQELDTLIPNIYEDKVLGKVS